MTDLTVHRCMGMMTTKELNPKSEYHVPLCVVFSFK